MRGTHSCKHQKLSTIYRHRFAENIRVWHGKKCYEMGFRELRSLITLGEKIRQGYIVGVCKT